VGNAATSSPIVRRLQLAYAAWARQAMSCTWLEPRAPPSHGPQVLFVLPHGHFCVAGKRAYSELTSTGRAPRMALFVDSTLCALSPAMKAAARLCGCDSIYPLGDKNVRHVMGGTRESIVVFPGGFVEAAGSTTTGLCLYAGTYAYWIRRCIEYGYDLRILLIYHGAEIYSQSDAFLPLRLAVAKRGLPGILPALPRPCPLAGRELLFHPKLEHDSRLRETEVSISVSSIEEQERVRQSAIQLTEHVCATIERVYAADADAVLDATGAAPRGMSIRSKL